jgi:hypothetical protein
MTLNKIKQINSKKIKISKTWCRQQALGVEIVNLGLEPKIQQNKQTKKK